MTIVRLSPNTGSEGHWFFARWCSFPWSIGQPYGYRAKSSTNGDPMNSDELKAMQAPIKERYREQPEAAVVTLSLIHI